MVEYIVEIISNGVSLDLSTETNVELNFSINDIRNPISINNIYSKTVILPGTPKNHIFFKNCFENNINSGFNPNLKMDCEIRVDSIPIIQGYLQLKEINKINETITYSVDIYGDNTSIFELMGDSMLADLDLTEYDHEYNLDNIEASWTGDCDNNLYYYPWINYSDDKWNFERINASGDSYIFYPAFYVKTLIDKMFQIYGYTYKSEFFNSPEFKSLIIPFTNDLESLVYENIVVEQIREIRHQYPDTSWAHSARTMSYTDNYGLYTPVYEMCGLPQYGGSDLFCDYYSGAPTHLHRAWFWGGKITNPYKGYWKLKVHGRTMVTGDVVYRYPDYGCDFLNFIVYSEWNGIIAELYLQRFDNPNADKTIGFDFHFEYDFPDILQDRVIYTKVNIGYAGTAGVIYDCYWTYTSAAYLLNKSNITSKDVMPPISQKDFFMTLCKSFNLYFERDPLNNKIINIEPYNDYYKQSHDNIDWTHKVDISNINQKLMSEIAVNSYNFTYKKDSDYLNQRYFDNNGDTILGSLITYNQNDFYNKEQKIELGCSPSCIDILPDETELFYPSIYKKQEDENIVDMYNVSGYTADLNTKWNWRFLSKNVLEVNGNQLYFWFNGKTFNQFYTASHIINYDGYELTNPISLLFDSANVNYTWEYPFSGLKTLYDLYWKDYLDLIRHQNSKLVTLDVYLTELEVSNLRFFEKIFINEDYYYLNKLVYSPTSRLGQCELLLIPASNYINIYFEGFYLTNTSSLYVDDIFTANVLVKNITRQTQHYSGWFSMVDINGTDIQDVVFSGDIEGNSTITISCNMTCLQHGDFKIYCNTELYKPYITINVETIEYTIDNLRLDNNYGGYANDDIKILCDITANDPDFTGLINWKLYKKIVGILVLVDEGQWDSVGVDSTTISVDDVLSSGLNEWTFDTSYINSYGNTITSSDNISVFADTHPTFETFILRPVYSFQNVVSHGEYQRPVYGETYETSYSVDWENNTIYDGTLKFNISVQLPTGTETFETETISTYGNDSGTASSTHISYVGSGFTWTTTNNWTATPVIDGITRSDLTITLTDISFTQSAPTISFTYRPLIDDTYQIVDDSSYQRPLSGSTRSINYYVDVENLTPFAGDNVYFRFHSNLPGNLNKYYYSDTYLLEGNDSFSLGVLNDEYDTLIDGFDYDCESWWCELFLNDASQFLGYIYNIHFTESSPTITWTFEPHIGSTHIVSNTSYQRPTIGNPGHIQWFVNYTNITPYSGSLLFSCDVYTPYGHETFNTQTSGITSYSSSTLERSGGVLTDFLPGVAYNSPSNWSCVCYIDGSNRGTSYLTNITFTSTAAHLYQGEWIYSPTSGAIEGQTLDITWRIYNDGYTDSTGNFVLMDLYNDQTELSKYSPTQTFSNITIPKQSYTGITAHYSPLYSPISVNDPVWPRGELTNYWHDHPNGGSEAYPYFIIPCSWNVTGDINSLTSPASGGTTQVDVEIVLQNNSCKQLDYSDYTLRTTWYSTSDETTVYSYGYPTTTDIPSGTYDLFYDHIHVPNGWTTGLKLLKVEISLEGGNYTTIQTDQYQYYNLPMLASNFVITSHSITQTTYRLQVDINVRNDNNGTGTVSATHLWYNPNGTQIRGTQTSSSSIMSGRTETLSNQIYLDEYVNGEYYCVSTLKYASTGITGSPVTDYITSCFYNLGTATYTDVDYWGDENECGGNWHFYSVHRATITLQGVNSGGTLNFVLDTWGTNCSVYSGDTGHMTISIPNGASSGYYQYTQQEWIECGGVCRHVFRYPTGFSSVPCGYTTSGTFYDPYQLFLNGSNCYWGDDGNTLCDGDNTWILTTNSSRQWYVSYTNTAVDVSPEYGTGSETINISPIYASGAGEQIEIRWSDDDTLAHAGYWVSVSEGGCF